MYDKIIPYIILLLMAFGTGIIIKAGKFFIMLYVEKCARDSQQVNKINDAEVRLKRLTDGEISTLKYLFSVSGIAWLPVHDISVISLAVNKCITLLSNMSTLMENDRLQSEQCYPCRISDWLIEYYREHAEELSMKWSSIDANEKISGYVHAI